MEKDEKSSSVYNNKPDSELPKEIKLYLTIIAISIIIASMTMLLLFQSFAATIEKTISTIPGAWIVITIVILRIFLISTMALYCLRLWLKQDKSYFNDLPNLLFLFFLILAFGKLFDIFQNLVTLNLNSELNLFFMKVRYMIVIFTFVPMVYFSLIMYLTIRSVNNTALTKIRRKKLTNRTMSILIFTEVVLLIFSPSMEFISILLPIIVILSLIVIVWVFFFAHKTQTLSDINPLVVSIGFLGYLFTQIMRPVLYLTQDPFFYSIISEVLDILVFFIIFWGLISKPSYLKSSE